LARKVFIEATVIAISVFKFPFIHWEKLIIERKIKKNAKCKRSFCRNFDLN
jgi:hypothetical protein